MSEEELKESEEQNEEDTAVEAQVATEDVPPEKREPDKPTEKDRLKRRLLLLKSQLRNDSGLDAKARAIVRREIRGINRNLRRRLIEKKRLEKKSAKDKK